MPVVTAPDRSRPLAGILWMLVTGALFVGVTAIVKHVGDRIPPAESAFLRYALGLVFLAPMLGAMRAARPSVRDLRLFGLRGAAHGIGVIFWFFAMTDIPIAEVTAMGYLSPIFVTLGAALFLGETLAARRIFAICAAFIGAMIILRPGLRAIEPGHLAMLANAVLFGTSYLTAKFLADRYPPSVVVGFLSISVTIVLAPFALANWVGPTLTETAWLALVAALATSGHYTMTLAFRAAPVTVTQPVQFLQLLWATMLGAVAFGEAVDPFVILGGMVILGSVIFITWREIRLKRRALTPPSNATKY
ncbi:DMT family transporter [Anianabacter salinae]|uniref:DMT family transporter n=1 Tax=Anianabacter salinae TaxID=2851023 RepID=UPI00225E037E|nr:DMT family transporter [Anianabacter salinae]MBV0913937.1 DMT family transporter [Anianabacter salinae]